MFRLTTDEYAILRSQFVTSKRGGRRYLPYAFTEQGVAMLSGVINSERAIETNIVIMRTFVLLRQYSFSYRELQEKLLEMEKKYNKNFNEVFQAIKLLFEQKTLVQKESKRETIGFKTNQGITIINNEYINHQVLLRRLRRQRSTNRRWHRQIG